MQFLRGEERGQEGEERGMAFNDSCMGGEMSAVGPFHKVLTDDVCLVSVLFETLHIFPRDF